MITDDNQEDMFRGRWIKHSTLTKARALWFIFGFVTSFLFLSWAFYQVLENIDQYCQTLGSVFPFRNI